MHREGLTQVVVHRAPGRVILFMGGERVLVIISAMFTAYMTYLLSFRFGLLIGGGVGGGIWFVTIYVLRKMAQADPQMWAVFRRHMRYRAFYPAHGRLDAPLPQIRDFK